MTVNATAALLGVGCAAGLVLITDGLRLRQPSPAPIRRRVLTAADRNRLLGAVGVALAVAVTTRWPIAALLAAAAAWALPELLGPDRKHSRAVDRIEAIATWTELLRDTLSSAAGLEQALTVTAPVAPRPIRAQVQALAGAIRNGVSLPVALRALADDLADPTGDLVVRALIQAAGNHGGHLTDCLTRLAATARDQASLRMRVATKRAATHTATRVISGAVLAMIVALVVFNRGFLAAYGTPTGQLMQLVDGAVFGAGFFWLSRASRLPEQPRLFAQPVAPASTGFFRTSSTPQPSRSASPLAASVVPGGAR